jgi:hypothetical protein
MNDELYRRILRMKALERWENEGGRLSDDQDSEASYPLNTVERNSLRGSDEINRNDP